MKSLAICSLLASMMVQGPLWAQTTEVRTWDIDPFNSVSVTGCHRVLIETGTPSTILSAEGSAEDLENLLITTRGNTLCIGFCKGYEKTSTLPVTVHATTPCLRSVTLRGSGDITVEGDADRAGNKFTVNGDGKIEVEKVDCRKAEFTVNGTGTIHCKSVKALTLLSHISGDGVIILRDIDATRAESNVNGDGVSLLAGCARNTGIRISGAGTVDAKGLETREVTIAVSGTGTVHSSATGIMDAHTAGGAMVYYYAEPAIKMLDGEPASFARRQTGQ